MLNIKEIERFYPENLKPFRKNILREYLQYKILEIIFNSKQANKLSFLGGTALSIIHGNSRFSEDLDFDNFNLKKNDFSLLINEVKNKLEKSGYEIESRTIFKGAFRCYLKFLNILFDNDISRMKNEKILIQIDTAPHYYEYKPELKILNKFDVFTQVKVTPPDILLSQKFYAIFNRKRFMGRDFYDVIFLLQKTKPNYDYLTHKLNISNGKDLKIKLLSLTENLDFDKMTKDVKPFLFNPTDSNKLKLFIAYIKQIEL